MNIHEMVRAYLAGEPLTSLAKIKGCKASKIKVMLRRRGVHIRNQGEAARVGIYRRMEADDAQCRWMPTPEEIEERCAEVRKTWSEDVRASRLVQDYGYRRFAVRIYRHNGVERCQYSEVG